MKEGSRVLGIDDGPRNAQKLIGVVYRGTEFVEQVHIEDQIIDNNSGTEDILKLYSKFEQDIKAILLDGVSFNGYNIANIRRIHEETGKPAISFTTNRPDKESMRKGISSAGLDTQVISELPDVVEFDNCFIQISGASIEESKNIIRKSTLQGNTPEFIRLAHLIGRGLNET